MIFTVKEASRIKGGGKPACVRRQAWLPDLGKFQYVDQLLTHYTPGRLKSRKGTSSKTPQFLLRFYYEWRPRFASICRISEFLPDFLDSMYPRGAVRKVRHCAANRALTGRIFEMIRVLFICHGSIWLNGQKPSIYAGFRPPGEDFYQRFINIRKRAFRCDKQQNIS